MKKAIVAGALGVTGRNLVEHLVSLKEWEVVGLSRRSPDFQTRARYLSVDLLNPDQIKAHLGAEKDVTHVFFAALQFGGDVHSEVGPNLAMLSNLVEVVEKASPALKRVVLVEGAKYYGAHLGPYKTPAREDDPRHLPPNFYYNQEDYLRQQSNGRGWSWSALRPSLICGLATGNPMNMATVIAVYATLCREFGVPFYYPGNEQTYRAILEMTDATLLAKAMVWAGESAHCAGEAFNITNGDLNRWTNLWPRLAKFFGLEPGPPQQLPLTHFMTDKGPVWDEIVRKYQLHPYPFVEAASWPFGQAIFNLGYDVLSDTTKCRKFGFFEFVDTEEMLVRLFRRFIDARLIPPFSSPKYRRRQWRDREKPFP
jgi:nucleoside-diphosphate-sugar epimerase